MPVAPDLPANETFDSVYPYEGFGDITAAAHAVVVIAYLDTAVTVDASRLPPELVESTSTTTALADWGSGEAEGVGEIDGVPELDGETDGVTEFVGETDGVPDVDGETDGVTEGDGVPSGVPDIDDDTVRVPDTVPLSVPDPLTEGVGDGDGDAVGEGD